MDFDEFIQTAWKEHADQPEAVADRLAGLRAALSDAEVAPWARLWVHVIGEHLGQWERGIAALAQMQPGAGAAAAAVIDVSMATLRLARGDADADTLLNEDGRLTARATAAAALAGRGAFVRALDLLEAARAQAAAAPTVGPAAARALAVAGNNIAAALEEQLQRSPRETAGMVQAARTAQTYWAVCGGWLETERAAFRLACSALQAKEPAEAVAAARHCVSICASNDADHFERFFAHGVLARALHAVGDGGYAAERDAALALLAGVDAAQLHWCDGERAALTSLPA